MIIWVLHPYETKALFYLDKFPAKIYLTEGLNLFRQPFFIEQTWE